MDLSNLNLNTLAIKNIKLKGYNAVNTELIKDKIRLEQMMKLV